ncbi:hemagglutinin repeat-containing protein [Pseudomonas sp. Irchel 3A5]|uniref:hemagglutinin repeat-containing protein n=1 Tax=Pseudomonas sp. Irchel 3A5 TaxID=2008911 RepID=UPI000BA458B1|nr:hemagglutinin repeat-containing protein [Pseudomonas sp. Irchel 3A5]
MDVHQFALLARQPSAELKPRKRFLGVSKRALALLMVNVMFWQPIWAQAGGVAVSGGTNTSVGQAANGVPVINIAAPNAAGLSHNQFKDYNVGKEGVILNNSTSAAQKTQLAGYINGNSQLGGKAAGVILNEVNGGSVSQLNGYTEVAGKSARVIIANPYGVTCNGCGFINTPRVTLSTGKPVLDGNGKLDRFEVDGGSVNIEGDGLNADNVDQFDIITRSAKINANIYAKQLNVVAGANDVNADTLATTARAGNDAEKPALAIDSSALGGMYANTIKLVGTEKGVGVKLAGDMAASGGDMQIDANGHLTMAKAAASGAVNVNAASLDAQDSIYAGTSANVQTRGSLKNQKVLAARDSITLSSGGQLTNSGTVQAGINPDNTRNATGDVSLKGKTINNTGNVVASRNLSATAEQSLTNSGAIQATTSANSAADSGNVSLAGASITNTGNVVASRNLTATASQVVDNSGTLQTGINADNSRNANGDVSLNGQTVTNTGSVIASRNLSATAGQSLANNGGIFAAGQTLIATTSILDNQNQGQLLSDGDMTLTADNLLNGSDGYISSGGGMTVRAGAINNRAGLIESGSTLDISASSLDNTNGQIRALGLTGNSRFAITGLLDNTGGALESANTDLSLAAGSFQNLNGSVLHVGTGALDVSGLALDNVGGSLVTRGGLTFNKAAWTNSSVIQAANLTLDVGNFQQTATGQLLGTNSFVGRGANWSTNGVIASDGRVDLTLTDQLTNSGRITSATSVGVNAPRVSNLGTLAAGQVLTVSTGSLLNDHALIFSGGNISLQVDELNNVASDIYAMGNLLVDRDGLGGLATSITNSSSNIQADGTLSLAASTIKNIRTILTVESGIYSASITPTACIEGQTAGDCEGGKQNRPFLISQRDHLAVTEASAASSITSGGSMLLTGGSLLNSSSSIAAGGNLTAIFDDLTNTAIETHDTQTDRVFVTERTRSPGFMRRLASAFTQKYSIDSPGYNKNDLGGLEAALATFIGRTEGEKPDFAKTTQLAAPDQSYSAIIQAGGAVNVQAKNGIDNSVVRGGYTYVGSGAKTDTSEPGYSTVVALNPQLTPDLGQQAVNPINLPGFQLPTSQFASNPQKYLIESDPAFTNLGRFLSSDYMLDKLGYNPDEAQKRLGDGYYEQKLIQQAVIARTGQRFIDGQTSDAGLFKYLMDNAIASKDALNLSVGVSLTGEQVAALTHDIVWMEQHEVSGQKVLVPVLYMAQANNRLAPNGALITGNDVSLISGQNLNNSGTLRATNNLGVSAGGNLTNSGLVEAGNLLQMRANNNLTNTAGGVIAGRNVDLVAVNGDLLNERSVTTHQSDSGYRSERTQFVNNAARIEAADTLTMQAKRDVNSIGSAIKSGGDTTIQAGRDVNIVSAQQENSGAVGTRSTRQNITQYGSVVEAGRDFQVVAARNISAVASQISAKRNLTLDAAENLNIASAADEQHSYSKSKKVKAQEDHVSQVSSVLKAGQNVALGAGTDLGIIGSRVNGGGNVSLDAGQDVVIASAQDEAYSYFKKKKTGSFGRSSTRETESYNSTNVDSVIDAGNDLTVNASQDAKGAVSINGGRDVAIVGSQLKSGNDLLLGATNDVSITSGVEESGSYSKKTKSGFLGLSKSGKTQLQTTATQAGSELEAGNDLIIATGNDLSLRASSATAGNDAELRAGLVNDTGDVLLDSAQNTAYSMTEQYKKKFGLSGGDAFGLMVGTPSWGGDITLSSSKKAGREVTSSTSAGSYVGAQRDVNIDAARDINVVGSDVGAGRTVNLNAGRDTNVLASSSQQQTSSWETKKSFGLKQDADRNGYTTFVGQETLKNKNRESQQTAAASHIDAGQDIVVNSGRDITQRGSDLYAENDIALQAGRDITIDAAGERSESASSQSAKRSGTTTTVSYNYGNMVDAVNGAGKGEDNTSKASSTLKAVDGVNQFFSGPTADGSIGNSSQSQSVSQVINSNRGSTMVAGNDISVLAGNDVTVRGSNFQAGRDINVQGRDVTFDVAKGSQDSEGEQTQSKGGLKGGTTGGFKIGIGGSTGIATQEGMQGTSQASQLKAGRDINLEARRDLALIGTQAAAVRNFYLKAANDLTIRAAQNESSSQDDRHSGGAEGGIAVGPSGIGFYASVNIGRGELDREGKQQQGAYLLAGNQLGFESGRDTTIAGAQLSGKDVTGNVGRNLSVSSVPDTGKASGKQFDVSATVVVGYGASVSGSVGYGKTDGKTNWVGNQTSITAQDKLDIKTGEHTQLDGALISSNTGNLKLDTGTLGFSDIAGQDKERSYYLNVGGSYGLEGGQPQQDSSQVSKGNSGANGWSVEGYNYEKDRQQMVRGTIGAGDIVVRQDAVTGKDSTAGLNRDVSKASEITRDEEHRTDLYVTKSSTDAVLSPVDTVNGWIGDAKQYGARQGRVLADGVNGIRASTLTSEDIPAEAKGLLGVEQSLAFGKKLVAGGMAFGALDGVFTALDNMAKSAAELDKCGEQCIQRVEKIKVTPSTNSAFTLGSTMELDATPVNWGEFNSLMYDAAKFSQTIPVAQIETTIAMAQVVLGPMKFIISTAANYAVKQVAGDQFDELKDQAAIKLVSFFTSEKEARVVDIDAQAKKDYADKVYGAVFNGSTDLLGARFMVDMASQTAIGSIGKAGGRIVGVVGERGANGASGSNEVLGGAHRDTSKPVNDNFDSHHCPARSCYTAAPISDVDGPAIKMDPNDHKLTASNGNSDAAKAYRAQQKELLEQGKLDEAIKMDIDDIRSKFGDKYDAAIEQMVKYSKSLNPEDFKPR